MIAFIGSCEEQSEHAMSVINESIYCHILTSSAKLFHRKYGDDVLNTV